MSNRNIGDLGVELFTGETERFANIFTGSPPSISLVLDDLEQQLDRQAWEIARHRRLYG